MHKSIGSAFASVHHFQGIILAAAKQLSGSLKIG